jgi:hypothetical protein
MTGVDPEVMAFYERGDEASRLASIGRLDFAHPRPAVAGRGI